MKRSILILTMLAAMAVMPLAAAPSAREGSAGEYQVKAAFLYNFGKFVEWPASQFASPGDPFQMCILGDNPFGDNLVRSVKDKSIAGHAVKIVEIKKAEEAGNCQIVFVADSEKGRMKAILAALHGTSALTVAEGEGAARQGAMIGLLVDNDQVRFEINLGAARSAGVNISSKLLHLAKTVIGD